MRLLCAAATALVLGLFVACADNRNSRLTDPKVRAEKLEELRAKFKTELSDLTARLNKAEDSATTRGIQSEMRELVAKTAEKALAIANIDPSSETGLTAALFVVESSAKVGGGGEHVDAAVGILAEHHAANRSMSELLITAARMPGNAGVSLLRAVAERGADKEIKATATFLQGCKVAQAIEDEEDEQKITAMAAESRQLVETAMKDAPAATLGGEPIAELGKSVLEDLKHLLLVAIGQPAPEIETTGLDGKVARLSDYKGKVVLLDIWATWCPPCREMIPHERDMVRKMTKRPFVLISVSVDDNKGTLLKFLEKEPMPWVHWWENGRNNPVMSKYRVRVFPTLYLIDHTGAIRQKWHGQPANDLLDRAVEEAVKEAEKAKG